MFTDALQEIMNWATEMTTSRDVLLGVSNWATAYNDVCSYEDSVEENESRQKTIFADVLPEIWSWLRHITIFADMYSVLNEMSHDRIRCLPMFCQIYRNGERQITMFIDVWPEETKWVMSCWATTDDVIVGNGRSRCLIMFGRNKRNGIR